jgi:hypothetical protein
MSKLFIALALLSTACAKVPPTTDGGQEQKRLAGGVYKFCDRDRAVYTYYSHGISVIPNAEECSGDSYKAKVSK